MQLQRGQRLPLTSLAPGINATTLDLRFTVRGSASTYETACFALDASERLPDEAFITFANQPEAPGGAVRFARQGPEAIFGVNLTQLDPRVERLVFGVAAEGGDLRGVTEGRVRVLLGGEERADWTFTGADFAAERSIMAVEVYRRNGEWRLGVIAQGFAGGLDALVTHFGGARIPPPRPTPTPAPQPASTPGTPPTAPPSTVRLTKVTLEKAGDSARISLRKNEAQPVHVNLNWNQPAPAPAPRGFLGKLLGSGGSAASADLDLGCMYELQDGSKGVIQALGGNFGRRDAEPFVYLDHDDRSGASQEGENLYIVRPDLIRRVLIYAFIYEGTANFQAVGGHLVLRDPQGNDIRMSLSNPSARLPFCAVALVERSGSEIVVRKEERYFEGHADTDQHYGFGFNWRAARKD